MSLARRMAIGPALWALLATAPARAQEPPGRLHLSGFGTLGFLATDTHQVAYPRSRNQPEGAKDSPDPRQDSRVGMQLNYRFNDQLDLTVQALSQYRYDHTFCPDLTWAALSWNPFSNVLVRLGRLTLDIPAEGELANVGYTYLWARPPQDVLGQFLEQGNDGVHISQTFQPGQWGCWSVDGWYGRSIGKATIVGSSQPWDLSGGHNLGASLMWARPPWLVRFSMNSIELGHDLPPPVGNLPADFDQAARTLGDPALIQTGDLFRVAGTRGGDYTLFARYNEDPVQVEGAYLRQYYKNFLLPVVRSGFLSFGYRVGPAVPYLLYARCQSPAIPEPYLGELPTVANFNPGARALITQLPQLLLTTDQRTWSAGVRWDFSEHADLKFQLDLVHAAHPPRLLYPVTPQFDGHFMAMSVVLDFVFGDRR
jgi:hypothetical protein